MVKIHRIWFNTERMDREDHYKITLSELLSAGYGLVSGQIHHFYHSKF